MAFASWLENEDGQKVLYFALGMTEVPSTWATMGFVGRAPCTEIERRGRTFMRCRGLARGHELAPGDFFVDPSLNSATLAMDAKGESHTVTWTGRGKQAEPYWHQHSGPGIGAMAMLLMWRRADTDGVVFGRTLGGRGQMFEGAFADVWANALVTTDGTRLVLDDGVLEVSKRF